jgi:hypothetical protein
MLKNKKNKTTGKPHHKSNNKFYLGVPPQEKCGVGLSVSIFFGFCI